MRLLRDSITFKFYSEVSGGTFTKATDWGFQIRNANEDMKKPQWALVLDVGPKVKHVKAGNYVLIDSLRWTNKSQYNGESYWRTTEKDVILVSDTPPQEI